MGGLLEAIGADIWGSLKKVVDRAASTQHRGQRPDIMVGIDIGDRTMMLRGIKLDRDIDDQLDAALARLEELGSPHDLWHVEEVNAWLTLDEVLTHRARQAEKHIDES
jgi:hypothetical protein